MTGYTDERFARRGQGSLWISCYTFTEMSSCSVAQAGKSQSLPGAGIIDVYHSSMPGKYLFLTFAVQRYLDHRAFWKGSRK